MSVKFFLITLDRRREISERNASIINNSIGEAIIVPGYDPSEITDQEFSDYSTKFLSRYGVMPLLNQLACLRAHVGAMKAFLETSDQFCVIGEDDFEITDAKLIIDCLANYDPKDREVLNFGGFQGLPLESMRILDETSSVGRRHIRFVHMMALYCVNRGFAENYVRDVECMGVNNDDWASLQHIGLFDKIRIFPAIKHGAHQSILDPAASRGYADRILKLKVLAHNLCNWRLRAPN